MMTQIQWLCHQFSYLLEISMGGKQQFDFWWQVDYNSAIPDKVV